MARAPLTVNLAAARVAANQAAAGDVLNTNAGAAPVEISGVPGQTVMGNDLDTLDHPSADYKAMEPYWKMVHDIVEGADAMRNAHDEYLPKFPAEDEADYQLRWKLSKFTNIYRDILENLASKPFEQEVVLVDPAAKDNKDKPAEEQVSAIPPEFEKFVEDVDGSGNNITVFAADTFFNGINSAIEWILVDYSQTDGVVRTVADEKRLGLRPYWTHVLGSNVLDARSRVINGKETIYYTRMREYEPDGLYIRILRGDGVSAAWELYRETKNKTVAGAHKFEFVNSGPITIGVVPMVPFITGRRKGRSFQFHPMMKDAAELQVELYQQESGLKNVETLAGFPMLVGVGVKPDYVGTDKNKVPKKLQTGPNAVLYGGMSNDKPGEWKFIQPDASIMKFLLEHVQETEKQLRELGRNPLTAQSGNLTVVTSAVAAKKGNSAVQMWAFGLKDALENALVLTGLWLRSTGYDPEVQVFTDFDVDGQGTDVAHLISARKNGDLSRPTFWHEMQRRGMLSGEFDPDEETAKLLEETEAEEDLNAERMETEAEIAARNAPPVKPNPAS